MANTSVKKQMQEQQCGSFGMQDRKKILYLLLLWLFLFPKIFMASNSVKKQMQAQQCGSCGMQDLRKNTIFTAAVAVLVPKYIYGQYPCKKVNASTAMWKFWHAGQEY